MSPRRNRSRRPDRRRPDPPNTLNPERVRRGVDVIETWGHEQWRVRRIPGSAAVKVYRCPGCDQEIRPGVPHLVAWPVDGLAGFGGEADRRHWHTGCWHARDRRGPTR